ncbi:MULTISPECIES: hypothetical protein [unclassified Nocardia]|uniref:hypothetical protein n=1 Tax=unclassified Nocardia TaxID=2637762 RepID=UPI0012DC2C71|nr:MULTISPECIES: hypothetical protein [unclassified Nocardia]MCX4097660.1 hypothetical protein [Nocardia sp. alder85J]
MRTPDTTPGNPDDNPGAVVIPLRRKALRNNLDNNREKRHETDPEQPVWHYDQVRKRSADRHYAGRVRYVHGPRAEQLRGELADVTQQLLEWAVQQQSDNARQDGAAA